jgi:predicted RNA-binding protein with PUA-like domain
MEIVSKSAYPDHTAFDAKEKYFDPKSTPENPRWIMVDVKFKKKLKKTVTLQEIKAQKKLADMRLVQRGNRLSILPVSSSEWNFILKMAGEL